MDVYTCKSGVMCMCEHIVTKDQCQVFSCCSPPWFLKQGLSLNLELTDLTRLASLGSAHFCLPSTGAIDLYQHIQLTWMLWIG